MNRLLAAILLSLVSALTVAQVAAAHGGGTDANGCHNDHKRGGYHCH